MYSQFEYNFDCTFRSFFYQHDANILTKQAKIVATLFKQRRSLKDRPTNDRIIQ